MKLISLCMIVRDEEATLERCLSSLRPYVDEIVIVDTGSVDGTVEIARRYADVFTEMTWQGMSACRNASMDIASGKYLLIVDADEYADGDLSQMRRLVTGAIWRGKVGGVELRIRNRMMGGEAWENTSQVRLFYNTPEVRYSGAIHNQYRAALNRFCARTGRKIIRTDMALIHTGYDLTPEERQAKYAARLKPMREEYARTEGPPQSLAGYHLACMLHSVQQHDEADALIQELRLSELGPVMRAQLANHKMVYFLYRAKGGAVFTLQDVARWERLIVDHGSEHSLFLYNLALVMMVLGQLQRSVMLLHRAWHVPRAVGFHVARLHVQRVAAKMLEMGGKEEAAKMMADATEEEAEDYLHRMMNWSHEQPTVEA